MVKPKNKWVSGLIIAGILAILAGGVVLLRSRETVEKGSVTARVAPSYELRDPAGRVHALSEFAGKPVLLHFWAAWCPPCLEEIPNWLALARRYEGKPLGFVAISLDPKWPDALKILPVAKTPANVISLIDPSGQLPEIYGAYQFPETYLLNSKHEFVQKFVGAQDWSKPEITNSLDRVLQGE